MRTVFVASCVVLFGIVGCSESHGIVGDGGPGTDAPVLTDGGGGCATRPGFVGCTFESAHVCGDAVVMATCVDDAWVCPAGSSLDPECWCSGFEVHGPECTCTPMGWSCPMPPCPADPASAEGTPCTLEGQSCGSCSDPCGWCNILSCQSHVWTRLEAPPPEPGTCESFACGDDLRCVRHEQYCDHILDDTGGPDAYRCVAFPSECTAANCTCFLGSGPTCSDDGEGAVEITSGGG